MPALHKLAHEHYDVLQSHPSWPMVTLRFIFDDSIGLFSRVKRPPKAVRDIAKFETDESVQMQGGLQGQGFGGLKD